MTKSAPAEKACVTLAEQREQHNTRLSDTFVADFVMTGAGCSLTTNAKWVDPRFTDLEVLSMNGTTALILIGAVVVIVFVLGINMIRRGRLRSLSPELKSRHAQSWTAIQARFLEEPAAAVQDADQLAVSILRDRGAKVDDDRRLPGELRQARDAASTNEGEAGTEGLRKAMLHYQAFVDDAVGESMRKSPDIRRKEVAS